MKPDSMLDALVAVTDRSTSRSPALIIKGYKPLDRE